MKYKAVIEVMTEATSRRDAVKMAKSALRGAGTSKMSVRYAVRAVSDANTKGIK